MKSFGSVKKLTQKASQLKVRAIYLIGVLGIFVAGAASSLVFASIPDSSGVIHGCYTDKNLRVIDTSTAQCTKNETPISWNQTGQPGPAGGLNSVANDVTVNIGDAPLSSPKPLFTVPGVGTFQLVCDANNIYGVYFTNNSNYTVKFDGGSQLYGGINGNGGGIDIAPSETTAIGAGGGAHLLTYNTGSQIKSLQLHYVFTADGTLNICNFTGQAIY